MKHTMIAAATAVVTLLLLAAATPAAAQGGYNPSTAWQAIHYSKAAYCSAASLQSWSCPVCAAFFPAMKYVQVFSSNYDTQAFVGYDIIANTIVVSFRGSHNFANWIADLSFDKVPYPPCNGNCSVHQGFYDAYTDISATLKPYVMNLMQQYTNPNNSPAILVTGHSLGAALSLFCTLDLIQSMQPPRIQLYNFGEPRVGDEHFPAYAASILPAGIQFRVTHGADPVPHLPPKKFGFLHTPREVWYDNNGNTSFKVCSGTTTAEDPTCSASTIPINVFAHLQYLGVAADKCDLP